MSLPLILKQGYADKQALLEDLIVIVNAEMKALQQAGVDYIQVDEPRYATSHENARRLEQIFNAPREGVEETLGGDGSRHAGDPAQRGAPERQTQRSR